MANKWFETVAEAQRRAKKRLPKSVYGALIAGSERGLTVEDNVTAFGELGFAPHVAGLADSRDLATKVMGQEISFPVLISPTGVQAVHPEGEVAVAAGRRGPGHRHGPQLVRQHAGRGRRGGQPADVLPDLLDRHAGPDRWRGSSGPAPPARSG